MGAGTGTMTGSDVLSRVEIKDRTLRRTRSVQVFVFFHIGGHGMSYRKCVQGGSDDSDGYGNEGLNLLWGGGS